MPTRPHSIGELADFAKDQSAPASRGIKDWLRVADALRKQGHQAIQDGDAQAAFLFLARSATYILEKIPHHPSYHELNPTQMSNLKGNGHDILHSLEQLKPRLADRYEQWLAKNPDNAKVPSQLQEMYGTAISPVVVSRAKRQDSVREGARPAVSSDQHNNGVRSQLSVNDLTRDMNGMKINLSPQQDRRPSNDGARRAWQDQQEMERRIEEDQARIIQEEAARRQWERDQEVERRRREDGRRQSEYDRAQQAKNAALEAAHRAAGYTSQSTKYRESSIASAATSPIVPRLSRSDSGHDALPHHPLQNPSLYSPDSGAPIWQANHTPTSRPPQPLYAHNNQSQVTPLDMSFTKMHIQYPQLMSAHQRAQGYQPSVLFPSPERRGAVGSSSHLYDISLPPPTQTPTYSQGRSNSVPVPQYSPAPPPPAMPTPHTAPPTQVEHYPPRTSSYQAPVQPVPHKRTSSMQEIPRHPLGLRPIDMPVELLDQFLGVARLNTLRKIETCGLLLGKPKGAGFTISTLLIPEQRGTQDTCLMESEELVVEFSTDRDMITLGWIHTHPTQSCFMSSLDLHTHCAYQSTLKEAIAIVCAPTSDPKFGIFRLTDPPGLDVVMNCRAKETFHPHPDNVAIYTDCDGSHVRLVTGMHLEIVDLRRGQDFSSSEGTRDI